MIKHVVWVMAACVALGCAACGDDDGNNGGTGGVAGLGGTGGGDEDAQVPLEDAGVDAQVPSETGGLTLQIDALTGMEGKQVLVEILRASDQGSIGGACALVDADPFTVTLPLTMRISAALCDYGDDAQIPVGDYVVSVQVQEPEVFPSILCGDVAATVEADMTTTATVSSFRNCGGGFGDGIYSGGPMSCSTQSAPMTHVSTDAAASIMDFRDATVTLERNGDQWVEIYEDDDCRMELTREFFAGPMMDGFVRFTNVRQYVWEPADCTLTVTAGGDSDEIGADFSYYQPTDDVRVDDVLFYSSAGAGYRVASAPAIWNVATPMLDLPCDMSDAFVRIWTRR